VFYMEKEKTTNINVRVNEEVKRQFMEIAESLKSNVSDLLRKYIDLTIQNVEVEDYHQALENNLKHIDMLKKKIRVILRENAGANDEIIEGATEAFKETMTYLTKEISERLEKIKTA